ncbi:MAG: hypothetical protein RBU21_05890 [FCB group bacterium]|nr:hypothetical protein [FCB group bacterium]
MKKLVFLGAMVLIVGGVALASSITVPFFNDMGATSFPPPTSGDAASFIAIKNNTNQPIVCWVEYSNDSGVDMTPTNNTFLLPAMSGLGFRPAAVNDVQEGAGAAVPDMDLTKGGGAKWGGAVISWEGTDPTAVQGRLMQVRSNATDSAMYTLPAGR